MSKRLVDLTGQTFGHYVVLGLKEIRITGTKKHRTTYWECQCQCGKICSVYAGNLRKGHSKSCGCQKGAVLKAKVTTHGGSKSREYGIWEHMKTRCLNPNYQESYLYADRGIEIHPSWLQFETFIKDMGYAPSSKHSLDRIDTNGNYEPGNCRWATATEQGNNKRNNRKITYKGETKNLSEWCNQLGLDYKRIWARLYACGWSPENAFETKAGNLEEVHL